MSTTAERMARTDAIADADSFRDLFADCFVRWEFAGSIRRRKKDVGDIDHVVEARLGPDPAVMFNPPDINLMHLRADELLAKGTIHRKIGRGAASPNPKSKPKFEKMLSVMYRGRQHQIFLATSENWGCILTIRTGSADFSHQFVTELRQHGYRQADGLLWKVASASLAPGGMLEDPRRRPFEDGLIGVPVPCPDEATYFKAAGLDVNDWPPEKREALR